LARILLSLKKFLHRVLTILLILAFSISGTLYFFFDAMQFRDKLAAQEQISSGKKLEVIRIPLKDFKIQDSDNEIWYGGQLYDVASYTVENDFACVVVYRDTEETELVQTIAQSFESVGKYTPANGSHILKHKIHSPNDGKILVTPLSLTPFTALQLQHTKLHTLPHSLQVHSAVIKPPPRLS